jgi:transmembrane protein EpsG
MCLVLAFILGFRDNSVGADTLTYANYYNYASYNFGHMEVGWNLLIYLFRSIGLSSYGFNFIIALITFVCIAIPLENIFPRSKDRFLGLFFLVALGFYFLMFNGMRQLTGIAICFYAFFLVNEGKSIKALVLIVLSATLHTSCLLALPAIFIKRMPRLKLSMVLLLLLFSMIIGLIANKDFYATIAGSYAYDVLGEDSFNNNPILYFSTMVLLSNAFLVYVLIKTPKLFHNNYWLKLYLVAMIIQSILFRLTYGQRIVYIYSISSIVLFPLLITEFRNKKMITIACYLLSIAFFLRFILQEIPGQYGALIPYTITIKPFS